jgi:hypothetical protein
MKELEKPLYEQIELEIEKKFFLKKLDLSKKEFEDIMNLPIKKHQEYGTNEWLYSVLMRLRTCLHLGKF